MPGRARLRRKARDLREDEAPFAIVIPTLAVRHGDGQQLDRGRRSTSSVIEHPPDLLIREASGLDPKSCGIGRRGPLSSLQHRKGLPDGAIVLEPTFNENPSVASEQIV